MSWRERIAKILSSGLPMDEASRIQRAAAQNRTIDAYHGTRSPHPITEFQTGNVYGPDGELLHGYSGDPNSLLGPHAAAEPAVANKFAAGAGHDWLKNRFTEGDPAPSVYPVKLDATKVQKFKREEDLNTLLFRQDISHIPEVELAVERRMGDLDSGFTKYDRDKAFREAVNRDVVTAERDYDEPSSEAAYALADAVRRQYAKAGVTTIQYPNAVEGGTSYISLAPLRSRFAAFDPAKKDSGDILAGVAGMAAVPAGIGALVDQSSYGDRQ